MTNEDAQKLIKQEKHVNGQPIVSRRYFVHTHLMQGFRVTSFADKADQLHPNLIPQQHEFQ